MMHPLQPLITTLALIALVSSFGIGFADDDIAPPEEPEYFGTLACGASGDPAPRVAGCFVKRRVLTLGDLEVSLGLDTQLSFTDDPGYAGAFVVFDFYRPSWAAFLEVATPSVMPPMGRGDLWRVGFTATF